jgi:tripartite-type tricarboxylate transporter receptor subunit TctC
VLSRIIIRRITMMFQKHGTKVRIYSMALSLLLLTSGQSLAQSPYYEGKTIKSVRMSAGGTGQLRVTALMPYFRNYIPGNPTIVYEIMAGSGGLRVANHIYNTAKPDGLTIGNISTTLVALGIAGGANVKYDLDKFVYLGTPISAFHRLFLTRKGAGLDSLDKLRAQPRIRIGSNAVGSEIYILGRLFAYLLNLRDPVFIPAYEGKELDVALLRGEIDARAITASTVPTRNPEWIEEKLVHFHSIIEVPKGYPKYPHPAFVGLPELEKFATSERDRKLLALYRGMRGAGTPYIMPPTTPKEQASILQNAMRKAFLDPEFLKNYEKLLGEEAVPMMPEELQNFIKEIPRDPDVLELFNKLASIDPLPRR